MEQKNLQSNNAEYSMTIPTSRPLWSYLLHGQRNSSKKLSRVEAFRDIIERQHAALLSGVDDGIGASVIELTKAWRWNRDTTSAFIDTLRRLGVVTCEKDGNRTIIRLIHTVEWKNISGISEKPSDVKTLSSATNGTWILFCGLIRHVNDISSNIEKWPTATMAEHQHWNEPRKVSE